MPLDLATRGELEAFIIQRFGPIDVLIRQLQGEGDLTPRVAALEGRDAVVAALPTGVAEGTVVIYKADAANGILWRLMYLPSLDATYPWHAIGEQNPLAVEGVGGRDWNTFETTASLNHTTLATAGPAITVPRAGVYSQKGIALAKHAVAGNAACILLWKTGDGTTTAWNLGDALHVPGSNSGGGVLEAERKRTFAASDSAELRYASSTVGSNAQFHNRSLYLRPIKVA